MSERETLSLQIRGVEFSMFDLRLYLDTHPNDQTAIALFNKLKAKNDQLIAEYERMYGPFNTNNDTSGNTWNWIKNPWPWQITSEA